MAHQRHRWLASGMIGVAALAAVLAMTVVPAAAQSDATRSAVPTFAKDVAPIFRRSARSVIARGHGTNVARELQRGAPWVRAIKTKVASERCRRGISTRRSASRSSQRSLSVGS